MKCWPSLSIVRISLMGDAAAAGAGWGLGIALPSATFDIAPHRALHPLVLQKRNYPTMVIALKRLAAAVLLFIAFMAVQQLVLLWIETTP